MNFRIIKDKAELDGTAYFEFLPGKYNGQCWNDHSIYLDEDSMALVEGVFEKHVEYYDHFAFSEFIQAQGSEIIDALENLKAEISSDSVAITGQTFSDEYYNALSTQVRNEKAAAVEMVSELIEWMRITLKKTEHISILGI